MLCSRETTGVIGTPSASAQKAENLDVFRKFLKD